MRHTNARAVKSATPKSTGTSALTPTAAEIAKALEAQKLLDSDITKIQALQMDQSKDKNEPIVLSDSWYEFTVFVNKFHTCPNTVKSWMKKGWLAYSEIGKMRFINKADVEKMMLHFRHPGIFCIGYILVFFTDLDVTMFF